VDFDLHRAVGAAEKRMSLEIFEQVKPLHPGRLQVQDETSFAETPLQ